MTSPSPSSSRGPAPIPPPRRRRRRRSSTSPEAFFALVLAVALALSAWTTLHLSRTTTECDRVGVGVGPTTNAAPPPLVRRQPAVDGNGDGGGEGAGRPRRKIPTAAADATGDAGGRSGPLPLLPLPSLPSTSSSGCREEYDRTNADRTPGLSPESLQRSRAWIGNVERLSNFVRMLRSRKRPMNVVICGGSITIGHGVQPWTDRYSARLQRWMNEYYPLEEGDDGKKGKKHRTFNEGAHGADVCSMAKRLNLLLEDLTSAGASNPDLFILEFAVNDYQGQDHKVHLDWKTDVYFDGFQDLALCAEVVVHKLLTTFPNAAVTFLEFQTAIWTRKTAASLHLGVAGHYEVPVISYGEAIFRPYWNLIQKLNETENYSKRVGDDVMPYPHGCSPCRLDAITDGFRHGGCKSVCEFMERSGYKHLNCDATSLQKGREPCYVPFLAHDAVHPSSVGHAIAKDLIVHAITSTMEDVCNNVTIAEHRMPFSGYLASPRSLSTRGNFVYVRDTMRYFSRFDKLWPTSNTAGWEYREDVGGRRGWICDTPKGNETIAFDVDLSSVGVGECYVVYLAVLRSYEKMGRFSVVVRDNLTNKVTRKESDGLWKPRISVWSDTQITGDDDRNAECMGNCTVTVITEPDIKGRGGNKVKILTLSARRCEGGTE